MDVNYWKDAYKDTWEESSQREKKFKDDLERRTGMKCAAYGLGAGSAEYISGSAAGNGYQKGDADFVVEGTNVYIEVTGPLTNTVKSSAPLWFRPDKLNNAIGSSGHDVFLAHHCMSADLWRVIHIDREFKQRFRDGEFPVVTPRIRGRYEQYVQIDIKDKCVRNFDYLVEYLKGIKGRRADG